MRGLKSTIALFLVLVGLGAYIYFVTWKKTDSGSLPKKDSVFAGLETPQIDELTVKSQAGEVTALKKSADKWQILKPIETPAAESDVAVVTSAHGQMEINGVVDEKPSEPRVHYTGRDGVDADSERGEIEGCRLHEPDHPELGGRVVGGIRLDPERVRGRREHNRPGAPRGHGPGCFLNGE